MISRKKIFLVAGTALLALGSDQITKALALRTLTENQQVPVIPGFFDLTLRYNTGAAFSLFASKPALFFFILSALAMAALVYFITQLDEGQKLQIVALGAILGGALGNLLDRARLGFVVDFLLLHYRGFFWPAFNMSDAFIVVGVFVFLWKNFSEERAHAKEKR